MITLQKNATVLPRKTRAAGQTDEVSYGPARRPTINRQSRRRVLLLHGEPITHYRIPIYNYFFTRFHEERLALSVAGPGIHKHSPVSATFPFRHVHMTLSACLQAIRLEHPDAVILFSGLRNRFIFPLVWLLRSRRIPVIYWGHGINLQKKQSHRELYALLHRSCNSIILYAEHLKQYIHKREWKKIVIANNTLCLGDLPEFPSPAEKRMTLREYGIHTHPNIVFVGRMQKRKRVEDLLAAISLAPIRGLGVVLVGRDVENVLPKSLPANVTHIPAFYGQGLMKLMMACDVCCCPGAVGLNIVDAMACGLPFVTQSGANHGPEIMYLKNGQNGILVPSGSIEELACALTRLLLDRALRTRMSMQAIKTYTEEASIERMFQGFHESVLRAMAVYNQ